MADFHLEQAVSASSDYLGSKPWMASHDERNNIKFMEFKNFYCRYFGQEKMFLYVDIVLGQSCLWYFC